MNAITADIEDFYSLVVRDKLGFDVSVSGDVERDTARLLDLLDECQVRATCFVVGRVAVQKPRVVRDIVERGHEVASHGFDHIRVERLSPQAFAADLRKSICALQDVAGQRIKGFRAPAFSLRPQHEWAFQIIADEGLEYDSSVRVIYPFGVRAAHLVVARAAAYGIREYPSFALGLGSLSVPLGGGGGLRVLPSAATRWGMARLRRAGLAVPLYCHPYDLRLDPYGSWPHAPPLRMMQLRLFVWSQRAGRRHVADRLRRLIRRTS